MISINYSNVFCIRFDFGLPLEDIFPPNDIHPRLHNLFYQTNLALKDNPVPLRYVLSFDSSLKDTLQMKETLINDKLYYERNTNPAAFFWLIRHFLGVLPLPLFPKFADGQRYDWEYLTVQCRLFKMKQSPQLESEISWWIHRLPKANVMLIYALIAFLRKISLKFVPLDQLDLKSVSSVTLYFSSSLFQRPYRPGLVTKSDKLYYPLLYYLIVNWPRIKKQRCDRARRRDDRSRLSSIWESEPSESRIMVYNACMRNRLIDCGCQTSSWLLVDKARDLGGREERGEQTELPDDESKKVEFSEEVEEGEESGDHKIVGSDESESSPRSQKCEEDTKRNSVNSVSHEYYEEINCSLNSNSEAIIYKKDKSRSLTPKILLKQKISEANRSLVSVISKVNEKLKSKQDTAETTTLGRHKYNLLKDVNVTKVQSLHVNRCTTDSPNIKYKKLLTI